jgi:hypothetical protein
VESCLHSATLPTRFCDFSTLTTDCAMVSLATMTALMSGVLAEHSWSWPTFTLSYDT